jgi:hypothetical protein
LLQIFLEGVIEVLINEIEQIRWLDLGFNVKGDARLLLIAYQHMEMRAFALSLSFTFRFSLQHAVVRYGYDNHLQMLKQMTFSFIFQPTEPAAMMPYRFGFDQQGIFTVVVACHHPLNEFMDLFCGHSGGFNPSHLAAMNPVVALRLIDGHDSILRLILAVCVTQVKQISIVESIAYRPLMVDHGFHKIIFAFQLLEGEHTLGMNHNLHQSELMLQS